MTVIKNHVKEYTLFLIFVIIFIALSIMSPGKFTSAENLTTMMLQLPELGFFTLAMMATLVTGGVNLSIITTGTLSGIVTVIVMARMYEGGTSVGFCILVALLAGFLITMLCGLLNAVLVTAFKAAPLLVTLGTTALFSGISLLITEGHSMSGMPNEYFLFSKELFLGIPMLMWIFIIVVVITFFLLEKAPWGRHIYMCGSNVVATEFSGVNIKKALLSSYLFSALMSFFAMVALTMRYNSMRSDYGSSYLMQSITACVLGGVSILGGYGSVLSAVIGAALLKIVSSGLNIFGVQSLFIDIICGMILLFVLALNTILTNIREKKI